MGTDGLYDDSLLKSNAEKPLNVGAEIFTSSLGYSHWTMRGYLYKRERFQWRWTKRYCFVSSIYLECHTTANISSTPACKLLLPGSDIIEDTDRNHPWAFKLHTRKEGWFRFAAENAEDRQQWIKALRNASKIETKKAKSPEDIRVNDPQMQQSMMAMLSATPPDDAEVQYIVHDNTIYMYIM